MCVCIMKTIQQMLCEISSANWTYYPQSIEVDNRLKIKGQKLGQGHNPQKAHLQPLRDLSVQYENNTETPCEISS